MATKIKKKAAKKNTVKIGANEYKRTATGRVHLDNRIFSKDLQPVELTAEDFRFTVLNESATIPIGGIVQSVTWTDDVGDPQSGGGTPVLTGTMSVTYISRSENPRAFRMKNGDVVRCEVRWFGAWREAWRMRVYTPEIDFDQGLSSLNLYDDLKLLMDTKDDLSSVFKKSKTGIHRRGWRAHDVAVWCAEHFHFSLDHLPVGKTWIKNLGMGGNASAYQAVKTAYQHEALATGRTFTIRWNNGRLRVIQLTGESVPYVFYKQFNTLNVTRERKTSFCTALTLTATKKVKHGKKESRKKTKLKVTVEPHDAIQRFGYIHASDTSTTANTETELLAEAKRKLARRMYQPRKVTFDHPGIPFFRAGEAMRIIVVDQGFTGDRSICFAQTIVHTLSAGSYMMNVTATFDPLLKRADTISGDALKRKQKAKTKKKNTSTSKSSATRRTTSKRKAR